MIRRSFFRLAVATVLVLTAVVFTGMFMGVGAVAADTLLLNDGRAYEGELVAQTRFTVNFRYLDNGIWATRTFDRRQISRIIEEDGDQSDAGLPEDGEEEEMQPVTPKERDPLAVQVAVIPLHGQVGGTVRNGVMGTFDAPVLKRCLEEAVKQGATLVILDIDSPGGLVAEMEAICDVIIEWHDRMRIIAHTHDAFSAAAIITLSCKEIAVRPDSRIGAATIVRNESGGGVSAIEAKFASPHYARQRQYMQQSGHPYDIVAAMTIQETELWWSAQQGFRVSAPADPQNWEKIDGSETILTMTADDARRWGIAKFQADTARSLLRELRLPDAEFIDLQGVMDRYNADLERRLGRLKDSFTGYFVGLGTLRQKMNELFDAEKRGDEAQVRALKREIPREVAKVRNYGGQILRADRTIVARRFAIPEAFIARIEEDTELVAGISRLIDSASTDGWPKAAERLNEMLDRWRDVLDGG